MVGGHFEQQVVQVYMFQKCTNSRLPWWLEFIRWHLAIFHPQYRTCFLSLFWCLELWGGF